MEATFKDASHILTLIEEECMKRPDLVKEEHRTGPQQMYIDTGRYGDNSGIENGITSGERSERLTGHCYVASEAFYHLVGGSPKFLRHEGSPHWYVSLDGLIVDPTVEQFSEPPQYDEGKGKGFCTKEPSERAQEIISAVEERL